MILVYFQTQFRNFIRKILEISEKTNDYSYFSRLAEIYLKKYSANQAPILGSFL